jgi:hypothetical protein
MHNVIYNMMQVICCVTDIKTIIITLVHKKMETKTRTQGGLRRHAEHVALLVVMELKTVQQISPRIQGTALQFVRSVKSCTRLDKVRTADVGRSYRKPE